MQQPASPVIKSLDLVLLAGTDLVVSDFIEDKYYEYSLSHVMTQIHTFPSLNL